MSRIVKEIEVEGKKANALFDTGAVYTYVARPYLENVPLHSISQPYHVALGGKTIEVKEIAAIVGKIEGLEFDTKVVPIDEIGRVNGHYVDIIIGALTMEEWEIKIDPKRGELDLEGLKRREFIEY